MTAIRPARPGDRERLLALWEALMENGRQADAGYALAPDAGAVMGDFIDRTWFVREPFPHCLVAEAGGLLGFVTAYPVARLPVVALPPSVRLGDLWVEPAARRTGVGRALVDEALRCARNAGFPRAEVGTLTADARAVAFWRSMGFADWQVTLARGA